MVVVADRGNGSTDCAHSRRVDLLLERPGLVHRSRRGNRQNSAAVSGRVSPAIRGATHAARASRPITSSRFEEAASVPSTGDDDGELLAGARREHEESAGANT